MSRSGCVALAFVTTLGWSGAAHAEETSYLGNMWQTRFDSPIGEGHATTTKKAVVLGLVGTGLVGLGVGAGHLVVANGLENDRQALLAPSGGQLCTSPQACAELQGIKNDYRSAIDTASTALVIGGAANALAVGVLLLWPNAYVGGGTTSMRVAPAVSGQSSGLLLEGSFQ
jgi:hypothetical protein